MTHRPRSARIHPLTAALVACAAAVLVLALPATAHRDGHRFGDDDPAGTVASYDAASKTLTVDLAEGGSVAGLVTRWTRIETDDRCDRPRLKAHGWCKRPRGFGHGHGGFGSEEALVAGAVVEDAALALADGRAFFVKVDLDD